LYEGCKESYVMTRVLRDDYVESESASMSYPSRSPSGSASSVFAMISWHSLIRISLSGPSDKWAPHVVIFILAPIASPQGSSEQGLGRRQGRVSKKSSEG